MNFIASCGRQIVTTAVILISFVLLLYLFWLDVIAGFNP